MANFQFSIFNFQLKIKNSTFRYGFTLIELLVTAVIILTLTGIGVASYNRFNQDQTLRQAGATLRNNLRYAQGKANSGEKLCGTQADTCGGTNNACDGEDTEKPLSGWEVTFHTDSYEINGNCSGTKFSQKSFNYSSDSNITVEPLPPLAIIFRPLSAGVINAQDICLVESPPTRYYKITIAEPSGDIIDYGIVSVCF